MCEPGTDRASAGRGGVGDSEAVQWLPSGSTSAESRMLRSTPAIVADMMWIEKHLPAGAANRVKFAFFSFDPEADTPERLKLYAEGHGLDLSRWTLLSADDDAVRELAAALGVGYRPDVQGGFDHTAVISLLDEKGEIVFQQRGTQASSDELLARLKRLLGR